MRAGKSVGSRDIRTPCGSNRTIRSAKRSPSTQCGRIEPMTTSLQFTKGHGTGNDFVLFADPDGEIDLTQEQMAAICDRHFGVGADGIMRAVRSSRLPDGAAALAED